MDNKKSSTNSNGLAIYNAMADGEMRSFAEIASIAKIEPKTGYLTAAKKVAKDNGYAIDKVEDAVEIAETIVRKYASGLETKTERKVKVAGYRLIKAE